MKIWRIWAKALGEKQGKNDREADTVAGIRTVIFLTYLITNCAIVANAIRHWDDAKKPQVIIHEFRLQDSSLR